MNAVTDLKSKIEQVEHSLSLTPKAELNSIMALKMKSKLKAYQEAYNLLVADDNEKKNDKQSEAESSEQQEQRANVRTNDVVIGANISTANNPVRNIERVEDEKYFFTSENAAKEYHIYRNRLRSRLHYWKGKKDKKKKNSNAKEELNVICAFYIGRINHIIDTDCKPQYQPTMRKKVYSLGNKDSKETYCFDLKKLKKDFDF